MYASFTTNFLIGLYMTLIFIFKMKLLVIVSCYYDFIIQIITYMKGDGLSTLGLVLCNMSLSCELKIDFIIVNFITQYTTQARAYFYFSITRQRLTLSKREKNRWVYKWHHYCLETSINIPEAYSLSIIFDPLEDNIS